ncbi:MAG: hypothetical protein Q7O66_06620, partial [Dehalococcoidia bacterium]|nr:hypothetical protein [Dehalococcoidia bacterium]
ASSPTPLFQLLHRKKHNEAYFIVTYFMEKYLSQMLDQDLGDAAIHAVALFSMRNVTHWNGVWLKLREERRCFGRSELHWQGTRRHAGYACLNGQ